MLQCAAGTSVDKRACGVLLFRLWSKYVQSQQHQPATANQPQPTSYLPDTYIRTGLLLLQSAELVANQATAMAMFRGACQLRGAVAATAASLRSAASLPSAVARVQAGAASQLMLPATRWCSTTTKAPGVNATPAQVQAAFLKTLEAKRAAALLGGGQARIDKQVGFVRCR